MIWNETLLTLNQRCKVSRLRRLSYPCLHLYDAYWLLFSFPAGTWLPHRLHLGMGLGCYELSVHCCLDPVLDKYYYVDRLFIADMFGSNISNLIDSYLSLSENKLRMY